MLQLFSSSFPVFFNLLFRSCQQPLVDSVSPFGAVTSHIFPVCNFQGYEVHLHHDSNIPKSEQWTTYCTTKCTTQCTDAMYKRRRLARRTGGPSDSVHLPFERRGPTNAVFVSIRFLAVLWGLCVSVPLRWWPCPSKKLQGYGEGSENGSCLA